MMDGYTLYKKCFEETETDAPNTNDNPIKVTVLVTKEMIEVRKLCNEDSNCSECPCHIGNEDCIFSYIEEEPQFKVGELVRHKETGSVFTITDRIEKSKKGNGYELTGKEGSFFVSNNGMRNFERVELSLPN